MEENIIKIENAALKLGKFSMKPAIINIPKGYIVGIQGDNGACLLYTSTSLWT